MKKTIIAILKYVLGLGLGITLLYFAFKDVDLAALKAMVRSANYAWVLAGIFVALTSHFFRALRWQMMMTASGYPTNTWTTFATLMFMYMVNTAIPRGGEVARCTMIYRSDKVPLSVSAGTVITERVFDLIILALFVLFFLFMESNRLMGFFTEKIDLISGGFSGSSLFLMGVVGLIPVISLVLFYVFKEKIRGSLVYQKIEAFLKKMLESAMSVFKLEKPWLFFFHTFMIWGCYGLMTWIPFFALEETSGLGVYFAFVVMTMGGIGMAMPAPGGIGPYHAAVIFTYGAFLGDQMGMEAATLLGETMAIIIHTSQLIMMIVVGFISYLFLVARSPERLSRS